MSLVWIAISLVAGYFIGAISFARIVGRILVPEEDLTVTSVDIADSDKTFDYTGVSATSVSLRKGGKAGCTVAILDMAKTAIPAYLLNIYFPDQPYYLIYAFMTVVGHNYPIYYKNMQGGRGLSPIMGGLLVIDWLTIPVASIAGMVAGFLILKDGLAAYTSFVLLIIPWVWWRFGFGPEVIFAIGINVAFWISMRPELTQYNALKKEGLIDMASGRVMAEGTDMGRFTVFLRRIGVVGSKEDESADE